MRPAAILRWAAIFSARTKPAALPPRLEFLHFLSPFPSHLLITTLVAQVRIFLLFLFSFLVDIIFRKRVIKIQEDKCVPDVIEQLLKDRQRAVENFPDPTSALAGSLASRMVRCNKPGCRYCEKPKGKGHGPIWIWSISQGRGRVRQIPIPEELQAEVEQGIGRFAEIQECLKQVAEINQKLLEERKRR